MTSAGRSACSCIGHGASTNSDERQAQCRKLSKNNELESTLERRGRAEPIRRKRYIGIFDAFMHNQAALRNYISRFMISSNEIDDVSQETFLRAYRAEQRKPIEEPKAFLFRIAKNMILSEFTKKSRKMLDYVHEFEEIHMQWASENLEDNIMVQQKLGVYCDAIATLPPKCRQVVLMKKVYGMSCKEIARRLGVSVSAVENQLLKGGKRCEAFMAKHYPNTDTETENARGPVKSQSPRDKRRNS